MTGPAEINPIGVGPMSGAHVGRYRQWWAWAAAALGSAVVLVVVVPVVIVPLLTADGAEGGTVGPTSVAARADGPPTWDQVLAIRDELRAAAESPDYPVDKTQLAAIATTPGPYTALGRIAFPTTGPDVAFGAGVHPSVLERGPGHWPGTALPGRAGNGVISGHRTTFTHPFADLDRLAPGDPIVLTPTGAATPSFTYRVVQNSVLPEAEYAQFVLRQPTDPAARELTLFACTPKGQRTHRIVVRAVMTPPNEEPTGATANEGS